MSQSVIGTLTLDVSQQHLQVFIEMMKRNGAEPDYLDRLTKSKYHIIEADVDGKPDQMLGFLVIQEVSPKYHTIEYVMTLLGGRDVALRAISLYEEHFKVKLIPHYIIKRSVVYWLRYFYVAKYIRCNSDRDPWNDLSLAIKEISGLDIDTDLKWSLLKTEYRLFTKFMKSNDATRTKNPIALYRKHKSIIKLKLIVACAN